MQNDLYVGIKGKVVAFDKRSGLKLWETPLNPDGGWFKNDFVNVWFDGDTLFAHAKGMLFCLEPLDGKLRWQIELKGDVATFASAKSNQSVISEVQHLAAATNAPVVISHDGGASAFLFTLPHPPPPSSC